MLLSLYYRSQVDMGSKQKEIDRLISLGVDAEFVRMLPPAARKQILDGVLGLQDKQQKQARPN